MERYYSDIKIMQPISDQDMNAMLAEESRVSHAVIVTVKCSALHCDIIVTNGIEIALWSCISVVENAITPCGLPYT